MKKFLKKVANNPLVKYIFRMGLLGVIFYHPDGMTTVQWITVSGMSLIVFINLMIDLYLARQHRKLKEQL